MARPLIPRYGIAEWFGNDITAMTPAQRQHFGRLAVKQDQSGDISSAPVCPFLATLIPGAKCNKASGVCSIRRFSQDENGTGIPIPDDRVVTICPSRFLQPLGNGKSIFLWIAETTLGTSQPTVIKETPFLRKVSVTPTEENDEDSTGKKAGRIDWIVVNPATGDSGELEWCAVETQSLYFSGDKMRPEFEAYAAEPSSVLFPAGRRRPDYRSSGPKRLSPQLDVKVPVLRNWGKKVVVVVDRYFHDNMSTLADAYPRARNDQERLDNSDVVWFVVDYDENLNITADKVIFTTLESSRQALNATEPLSKSDFTRDLKSVMGDAAQANKVFKVSAPIAHE